MSLTKKQYLVLTSGVGIAFLAVGLTIYRLNIFRASGNLPVINQSAAMITRKTPPTYTKSLRRVDSWLVAQGFGEIDRLPEEMDQPYHGALNPIELSHYRGNYEGSRDFYVSAIVGTEGNEGDRVYRLFANVQWDFRTLRSTAEQNSTKASQFHSKMTAWWEGAQDAEQAGAGQPATRPESKSEGSDTPQPEAEGRSR